MKKGIAKLVLSAAGTYKMYIGGFNALIVHHKITGGAAGGYASLKMSDASGGTFIAHHGKGTNIKAADTLTSYTSIFEGLMDYVEVTLAVTDGAHEVTIQPLEV